MDPDDEPIAAVIAEPIAEAVAAVIEEQNAAGEIAEQIAEAALEGARGERIAALERDFYTCLDRMNSMEQTLEMLPGMLAEATLAQMAPIAERLNAVEAVLLAPTLEEPPISIPPALEEPIPVTITDPAASDPPPVEEESPAPEPRKKRFRSI